MTKSRLLLTSFIAVSFSFVCVGVPSFSNKAGVGASEIAQANSKKISEADINRILDELSAGTEKRDLDAFLVKYAVPYAYGQFSVQTLDSNVSVVIEGRDSIRARLKDSYAQYKQIKKQGAKREVLITDDGQIAVATDDSVLELTDKANKKNTVASLAKIRFALVNGELKIISFESRSHVSAN